jgi:hypothetical protein
MPFAAFRNRFYLLLFMALLWTIRSLGAASAEEQPELKVTPGGAPLTVKDQVVGQEEHLYPVTLKAG